MAAKAAIHDRFGEYLRWSAEWSEAAPYTAKVTTQARFSTDDQRTAYVRNANPA